ncbi:hypothetical protein HELRODRAFT_184244 [Helobdella robusta]|uniref:Uncharacterized protein n=1 Tax=Helobdella robusta TaxID=6412 RepID=T1FKU4_HELRO|nr:hypothetical protein HELRODRAFT_184244 [Helobdella robusta]ESO04481.1 hypothetical protein HELRODRAFT_184244 [Helobdella robusta]
MPRAFVVTKKLHRNTKHTTKHTTKNTKYEAKLLKKVTTSRSLDSNKSVGGCSSNSSDVSRSGCGSGSNFASGDLPDLLPPQIPPRNSVAGRKVFDGNSFGDEGISKHSSMRSFQAFGFGANNNASANNSNNLSNLNNNNNISSNTTSNSTHHYGNNINNNSIMTGQFSTLSSLPSRGSHINVNVAPTVSTENNDTPEIHKYQKRFNSDVLCAALWGVNLLIGTDSGLVLLDRSGQGKASRDDCEVALARRFNQPGVSRPAKGPRSYEVSWNFYLVLDKIHFQSAIRNGFRNQKLTK